MWSADSKTGEVAEFSITHGWPSAFSTTIQGEFTTLTVADVGGHLAVTYDLGGKSAVIWSPSPDVTVRFGTYRSIGDALALARTMQPVDPLAWNAVSVLDISGNDGGNSMFC